MVSTMKKINIAFVNIMDCYSGGEKVLERIVNNIDRETFHPIVVSRNTDFLNSIEVDHEQLIVINRSFQLGLSRSPMVLFKLITNFFQALLICFKLSMLHKVKVVHSNSLISNVYFSLFSRMFGMKFIGYSHEVRYGLAYKVLHRYLSLTSSKIITVSEAVRKSWIHNGADEKKVITIYNGL